MNDKIINLKLIKSFNPCKDGLENFIKHHKDFSGSPLELLELENVPVSDKFWLLLRNEFIPENDLHELGCKFAESVLHIYEEQFPKDQRPRQAIETKRKFIRGLVSKNELGAARDAARAAEAAARAAEAAAEAAAWAAEAAWDAARDAARQKQLEIVKEYFNER